MHHSAQAISSGWKNNRVRRAPSESSPNASAPSRYCDTLPGKTATKKAATTQPTSGRRRIGTIRAIARAISTTPDATTTRSTPSGSHSGTWAWNVSRAQNRCDSPANPRNPASSRRARVRTKCPIFGAYPRVQIDPIMHIMSTNADRMSLPTSTVRSGSARPATTSWSRQSCAVATMDERSWRQPNRCAASAGSSRSDCRCQLRRPVALRADGLRGHDAPDAQAPVILGDRMTLVSRQGCSTSLPTCSRRSNSS